MFSSKNIQNSKTIQNSKIVKKIKNYSKLKFFHNLQKLLGYKKQIRKNIENNKKGKIHWASPTQCLSVCGVWYLPMSSAYRTSREDRGPSR
jgi:hypothetical protein